MIKISGRLREGSTKFTIEMEIPLRNWKVLAFELVFELPLNWIECWSKSPEIFDFVSNVGISNVIIAVHQHIGDGSWFQFFERFSKICNNLNFFCDSEVSREGAGYCTIHFTADCAKIGLANHSTRTLTHTWVCFLGERIKMLVFSHAAAAFCFRCFNFTLHRNEQA